MFHGEVASAFNCRNACYEIVNCTEVPFAFFRHRLSGIVHGYLGCIRYNIVTAGVECRIRHALKKAKAAPAVKYASGTFVLLHSETEAVTGGV